MALRRTLVKERTVSPHHTPLEQREGPTYFTYDEVLAKSDVQIIALSLLIPVMFGALAASWIYFPIPTTAQDNIPLLVTAGLISSLCAGGIGVSRLLSFDRTLHAVRTSNEGRKLFSRGSALAALHQAILKEEEDDRHFPRVKDTPERRVQRYRERWTFYITQAEALHREQHNLLKLFYRNEKQPDPWKDRCNCPKFGL